MDLSHFCFLLNVIDIISNMVIINDMMTTSYLEEDVLLSDEQGQQHFSPESVIKNQIEHVSTEGDIINDPVQRFRIFGLALIDCNG